MKPKIGAIKFGGITFILSGILFFAQYLFVLPIPTLPLSDADLVKWLQEWRFNISMADELMFFAALLLIPSLFALYRILVKADKIKTVLGCGLLAATVPVNILLVVILGRLVYPVYEIELSPEIYKLVLSIYYGGLHSVAIILGMATIILCLVIGKSILGKPMAYFGFTAGLLELVGAYPWLIGSVMVFVSQLVFSAWFVMLGLNMAWKSGQAEG
ncbi:hypothetical protein DFP94_101933 [Fontibacillus phaseoli]|uniref:DUF4386 family protein n=1 Tax=Fontibacillus phaseoli TaxID=1416533 RepID=A0A369BRW3_9BACL|nr:hypothetical protein [Fontibacillus phaseoli]RCX23336.1 hypothetical protein DFP94_101933 [Fontibacillus phaseoli]